MNQTSQSPIDRDVLLQFKNALQEKQRELQNLIEKTDKEVRALSDSGPCDPVDLSSGNSSKESMFARNRQNRKNLHLTELALERVRKGKFGICLACEDAIGLKRLKAVPWTGYCIQCQERSERGVLSEGVNFSLSLSGRW
jgi:DnaK suppressor protein